MLTKFCINKPWTVVIVMLIVIMLGIISYTNTSVDLLPSMNLPYVVVASVKVGASPEAVEADVTKPTEAALSSLSGVKNMTSVSMENVSMIIIEFKGDINVDDVVVDIRESLNMQSGISGVMDTASGLIGGTNAIDEMMDSMAVEPMIFKINPSMLPVMMVSMGIEGKSSKEAAAQFGDIISDLEAVEGVASVTAQGMVDDIVLVQISGENLLPSLFPESLGMLSGISLSEEEGANPLDALSGVMSSVLTPSTLSLLLSAQNMSMPAGSYSDGGLSYFVKVGGEGVETVDDLKNLPLVSLNVTGIINSIKNAPEFAEDRISLSTITSALTSLAGEGVVSELSIINGLTAMELPEEVEGMLSVSEDADDEGIYVKTAAGAYELYDASNAAHVSLDRYNAPAIQLGSMEILGRTVNLADMLFGEEGLIETDWKDGDGYYATLRMGGVAKIFELDTSGSVLTTLNGQPTVTLTVSKQSSYSTAEVSKALNKVLEQEVKDTDGFFFVSLMDQGYFINEAITSAGSSMLIGGLLAVIVLLLFLKRIRPTLIVGVSIAISVVCAFVLMYFSGVTLNVLSMGGLALGVGMLVDNSIVVIENIYRQRKEGKDIKSAAIDGTKQVLGAIVSSTITTVIIFVPIFFVSGMVKDIFRDMALTIMYSLIASLVFAITLVPMAANTFLKNEVERPDKFFNKIREGYKKAISFSLDKRWVVMTVVAVLLIGSIIGFTFMGKALMPMESAGSISGTVEIDTTKIPEGKTLDEALVETIDDINAKLGEADYLAYYSVAQSSDLISSLTGVGATTTNKLTVTALIDSSAKIKDKDAANRLREALKSDDGAYSIDLSVQEDNFNLGELLGSGVSVNVYCEDLDDLKEITILATEAMREVEGVKSVSNGLEELPLEYNLKIDYEKAKLYNINSAAAIMQVSQALAGGGVTSSIKFKGDVESTSVKFYPSDYVVLEWVKTADENGNYVKVYLEGNSAYIINNKSESVSLFTTGDEPLVAATGDKIKLSKKADDDEIVRAYTYRLADGTTKTLVTDQVPRYYYSAAPKTPVTLTTMWISNDLSGLTGSDMGINMGTVSGGASGAYLWQILDDSCFTTDASGNIITVDDGTGNLIPAEVKKTEGYFSILRLNGKKYLTITGDLEDGYDVDSVSEAIDARLQRVDFDSYYATYGFEGQMAIINEVFTIMLEILIIGIILVYLVMVAQFQSLKSPFIIMATIPLALSGCAYSLLLCGMDLTAPAFIGVIILVGVIVNNGIVFVDYANQLVRGGMSVKDALIKTGYDRLRPILMTAFTTVFGMASMALDQTAAGSLIRPMAVAAMGGLLYASLLTLFVVPVIYSFFNANLEDKRIKNNPPKAYPSSFTAEDIASYEGTVPSENEEALPADELAVSAD